MKIGFLGSLAAVLAGTGVALAQPPASSAPAAGSTPPAAAAPEALTTQPTPAPAAGAAGNHGPAGVVGTHHADGCGDGCCRPTVADCDDCYRRNRFWGSAEYLLWNIKDQNIPPQGAVDRVPITLPVLGQVTAIFQSVPVLPGGLDLKDQERSGLRLSAGFWLDDDKTWGIEVSWFEMEQLRTTSIAGPQMTNLDINTPILVPVGTANGTTSTITDSTGFMSTITTSQVVTQPLTLHGTLSASALASGATRLWGTEVNCCTQSCCFGGVTFDLLLGVRYLNLSEDLLINNNVILNAPPLNVTINSTDAFATRNQLIAPQIGIGMEWICGPVYFDGVAKLGVGGVHQMVNLLGTGTPTGGLLIPTVDAGEHTRDRYTVIPEVTANVGYFFTRNIRGFVGYNFLYMTNTVRPGDQIAFSALNTQVMIANQTTNLTTRETNFKFSDRDVWIQGVNFGLEFRY